MSRPVHRWLRRTLLEFSALLSALIVFFVVLSHLDDGGAIFRWNYAVASYETEVLVYSGWLGIHVRHVDTSSFEKMNILMSYLFSKQSRERYTKANGGISFCGLYLMSKSTRIHPPKPPPAASPLTRSSYIFLGHLGWLIALTALPPLIAVVLWCRRRPWIKAGHCRKCGYDLRASRGACPECGDPIPMSPARYDPTTPKTGTA